MPAASELLGENRGVIRATGADGNSDFLGAIRYLIEEQRDLVACDGTGDFDNIFRFGLGAANFAEIVA